MTIFDEGNNEENKNVETSGDKTDQNFWQIAVKKDHQVNILAMIFGFAIILIGVVLLILGVEGIVDFNLGIEGINVTLQKASPGVFIIIVGLIIIIFGIKNSSIKSN